MSDVTQDIHSLTTFKRNSSDLMRRMKKAGRPLVLTANGKAEAVLLRRLLPGGGGTSRRRGSIRRGLAQARKGAGRSADEVFDELEREDSIRKMIYHVVIAPEAETDLRTAYRYIRSHASQAARPDQTCRPARQKLCSPPRTLSPAPESVSFDQPIRELLFGTGNRGTYCFLLVVLDKSVYECTSGMVRCCHHRRQTSDLLRKTPITVLDIQLR